MENLTLDRNRYEALRSLLAELEDIEDLGASIESDGTVQSMSRRRRFWLAGSISKDNMDLLRQFIGLGPVE